MAVEIVMPPLGQPNDTGRLLRWLKREGELVTRGEPLLEVETEKTVIEVEAPGSGVLSGVRVREGEEVAVGTVLAYLLAPAVRPGSGGVWRAAAERVARSWHEVPHLFLFRDVDASQLIVAGSRQPQGVTRTDLLIRLAAVTLVRHPAVNAGREEASVAFAVASEDGQVAPVIHGADELDVRALAARRAELEARARSGDLRAQDLAGATFTLADLGPHGVDAFLPILAEGQAGGLGVGRVADRVVPVEGRPQVRPVVALTLACDGRAVDGIRAARFLQDLAVALEEPARWL
jgi:pyruvate/2-oxoglutarate dehydrogenase complex dihydrolipoamide acyltransferase (E2) component